MYETATLLFFVYYFCLSRNSCYFLGFRHFYLPSPPDKSTTSHKTVLHATHNKQLTHLPIQKSGRHSISKISASYKDPLTVVHTTELTSAPQDSKSDFLKRLRRMKWFNYFLTSMYCVTIYVVKPKRFFVVDKITWINSSFRYLGMHDYV